MTRELLQITTGERPVLAATPLTVIRHELTAHEVLSEVRQNDPVVDDEVRRRWREALEVELVPEQTADELDDSGWGDRPRTERRFGATDPDVQRYLDEKPPHH